MRVVVLGLGYVGAVCAGCLSRDGLEVIGVDINESKVRCLQEGRSPVLEPGLEAVIADGWRKGRLKAARSLDEDARQADAFLICVGTPSASNGSSDLSHLLHAVAEVGDALRGGDKFQVVNVRSTVPPGTLLSRVIPLLEERSGRKAGADFGVAMNPEFLREGTSIHDYDSAPFDLCGTTDNRTEEVLRRLYQGKGRPFRATSLQTAEVVKYVNNAFHALKIAFANEIGRYSKAKGVNSLEVMDLLCQDHRLNISPAYLKPGMAFGGSCLPKDLRALAYEARRSDVRVPLLEAVMESNEIHLAEAIRQILSMGRPRTALLGLSFKPGTDDLRESPMVRLAEQLLGKGLALRIWDRNVRISSLVGANREYIQREIPHIGALMVETIQEAIQEAEVVVLATDDGQAEKVPELMKDGQILIDLFGRVAAKGEVRPGGICW